MSSRISSLDDSYQAGDLSVFHEAVDTRDTLYEVKNNAATTLKLTLPLNSTYIVVEDATSFPSKGLLRIGPANATVAAFEETPDLLNTSGVPGVPGVAEMVYYGERTATVFKSLQRGFCGTRQSQWSKGTAVSCAVFAEQHNALKDAMINIETFIGTKKNPSDTSLNGRLEAMESKFLAPSPLFRAYPRQGKSPLTVRFQNLSNSNVVRYLWDFGDGTTSVSENATHVYNAEGTYTVTLNIITSSGGQGIVTKNNYITVDDQYVEPFFYTQQENPSLPAYSQKTAIAHGGTPATFIFVDQTTGTISQRFWDFGDGNSTTIDDPNVHVATHIYALPGDYIPTLICVFADQSYKRVFLTDQLAVL